MTKKLLKQVVATTAILATTGTPAALAQEVDAVTTPTEDAAVNATTVESPKTSADVKPALDAQQAVVDATAQDAANAQSEADSANQHVANAQADVDTATQAVKDAEANAAKATPENIEANQADQAANLADQAANATETDQVNAEIADQTGKVADAQTAVDTAQSEKDAVDADVTNKEADVKAAQDALSGTGLVEAQANLDQAKKDVTTAETNVTTATQAVATAKQADADRDAKIKAAEIDVKTKSDAVDTSKAVLTKAQDDVKSTTDKLTQTTDAVKKAADALKSVDVISAGAEIPSRTISDNLKNQIGTDSNTITFIDAYNAWKKQNTDQTRRVLTGMGVEMTQAFNTNSILSKSDEILNINELTDKQKEELTLFNLSVVNAVRQSLGLASLELNTGAMTAAQKQADAYIARNKLISTDGHIIGDYFGENASNIQNNVSMTEVKQSIYRAVMTMAFADNPSNWGHLNNITKPISDLGVSFATFGGQTHMINVFGVYSGDTITNPNDPATLQAALTKAQADQAQAQTASDAAKAQLTKASADYATALEAKTAAEKVLADATATPLQTQVAENNLRLAEIALTNAQTRQADAQKAVDNFSADLATKKATLDDAKAKLADAQAVQADKATARDAAKAELTKQEDVLAGLNAEKVALLAEKDHLVEEAKALAAELKGYLEAPAILAQAQADLSEKEAVLATALAKAETANKALEVVTAKLAEEKAKLAELQEQYDTLKDLEDKAKSNVIATLPDGTVIAKPNVAPTAEELPTLSLDDIKAYDAKKAVMTVSKPQAGVTVTTTASGSKTTYSRVERAKTLPQTGEQESLLGLVGLAMISSLGLAGVRRRRG